MAAPGTETRHAIQSCLMVIAPCLAMGCTMIPPFARPAAPVDHQFAQGAAIRDEHVASDIAWRDFVAEETLRRLIEIALQNNRDLRIAALAVAQSQAEYRITRAASWPAIDASAGFSRQRGPENALVGGTGSSSVTIDSWSANVGTTAYELDLFGRVRSLNRQALEQYLATVEAKRASQVSLVGEVTIQYASFREAQEQLELANHTFRSLQETYEVNKATYEAGASNEIDLRIAAGQVETARLNILTYERQVTQAKDALVFLIGEPMPQDLPPPDAFRADNVVSNVAPGLPSDLLESRPDIIEAEHTLKAANANIGAARAAFFPTIALTSSIGGSSVQLSSLFSAGSGTWTFAPQVTLPIFSGGKNRATLELAHRSYDVQLAEYEKAIQTAFREVSDALIAALTYAKQIDSESALITAQQRRFDLATLRYAQGEDTYINVLLAQQDLYGAQQGRLQAEYNLMASRTSLYQALGGGWK
jgi:multidrug efflux system outer membrane protein